MSRITTWKLEKAKVKVVFRLQFHATHIPQTGWDKLFISFIPTDSGKATAKTGKSNVRNGTCKWADPIYETTRLLQDMKTKQYDEKPNKLVVSMGSSRSSLLGEATINLADFADASKPSTVALPLHGCNFGTVLHVTVQLLTSKTGFREFEQQRELRGGLVTNNNPTNTHNGSDEKLSASTEMSMDHTNKASSKVRFKTEYRELPSLVEKGELNEDYAESSAGIDDSSNTSESLYAERNDSNTHEIDSQKSTISGDLGGTPLSQSPHPEKGDPSDQRLVAHGSNEWVHGWSSDYSMDNDLATAYEENSRLRGSLEVAESSISELKLEISSLHSNADELAAEMEKFTLLLAKEIASGEELGKEVSVLKSVCSKLKADFEQFKHSRRPFLTSKEPNTVNQVHLFQDLRMGWLQCLVTVEDKVHEIQNKVCLKDDEMVFSFLQPELEALQLALEDFKQKTAEVTFPPNVVLAEQADLRKIEVKGPEQMVSRNKLGGTDAGQCHHEGIFHCLYKHGNQDHGPVDAMLALEGKFSELQRELEESNVERDSLMRKMDQMECYYEALIQELEENQKQMLGDLQNLRNEHSTCLYTITSCNSQMEKMHEDINDQLLRFSEDRLLLEAHNKELEERAINSETALKRARWNYSIAVDQLQKDLELLSFQVLSMFETNENLIRQAFADTSQACFVEHLEENSKASVVSCLHKHTTSFLQKQQRTKARGYQAEGDISQRMEQILVTDDKFSLEKVIEGKGVEVHADPVVDMQRGLDALDFNSKADSFASDLQHCQNQNAELKRKLLNEKLHIEDLKRSLHLHEECYERTESDLGEIHLENLSLNVFSDVLQGVLHEVNNSIKLTEEKIFELRYQLAQSTESNELLMLKLQNALEDVNRLEVYKVTCGTKCEELNLQNQTLQEKCQGMSNENGFLTQKVTEYEKVMVECENYKARYEDCTAEKTELVSLLNEETLTTCSLQNEVSSLHEKLAIIKADLGHQSSVKRNLEQSLHSLQNQLWDIRSTMSTYHDQIDEPSICAKPSQQELEKVDFASVILQIQDLHKKAHEMVLHLTEEKKEAEAQRDISQRLLSSTESEISVIKQKYESDVKAMANRLDATNALAVKLQLEIDNVANKLKSSLEAEERHAEQFMEISTKLAVSEVQLQQVTLENKDLAQKIVNLESINEELERTKLIVADSSRQNQDLTVSLQAGNEMVVNLQSELNSLKENLRSSDNELLSERSFKEELEHKITVLTSELNTRDNQLNSCDLEKAEVVHLKQLVSDLELEKSTLCSLLGQSEECRRKAEENSSLFLLHCTHLETHLAATEECFLAADIELTCVRSHFHSRIKELVQQLESLDRCYRELHLKHLDLLTTLNGRISTEAQYVEENARSLTLLNTLRSELEATTAERISLLDKNHFMLSELENYKAEEAIAAKSSSQDNHQHELEMERLKHMLLSSEEAIDNLRSSNNELEIIVIVLRAKFEEQHDLVVALLQDYGNELVMLRTEKNELNQRLSDQISKTEELKNLSDHLKELKDKAESECLQAREKIEYVSSFNSTQESLRMAFIREQCETKLQELQNHLYISKKHGEEILLKLQDALNEVENLKKSEVSLIKRNEELSLKTLELESELQALLADKRASDELKAELECSLISLDCCKEEKQKLEASLQQCLEERMKVSVELDSLKDRYKSLECTTTFSVKRELSSSFPKSCEEQDACLGPIQDCKSEFGVQRQNTDEKNLKQLAHVNNNSNTKILRSSMDCLHKELEKMKNENLVSLPQDAKHFEPDLHGLQRQFLQLHKANEQLGSIFPLFNEFSSSGNALERVLALEIELAEALQGKKRSNVHFQSSFLKQHPDEEAVFQSFRDINELIQDMLALKERYTAVESELKEMHDRYSQLSLQFAEVEGERQKLVMTVKNARVPKKMLQLSNSSPSNLEDPS